MHKFADVPTSGTALDWTAAAKRKMFRSGGAGAAWVKWTKIWDWYLFCGAVDDLIVVQTEEMNCLGGERGNGLTLFATGLLTFSGTVYCGEGAKRNAAGIKGEMRWYGV